MAVNELHFKELPFRPDRNQVFYIENGYDAEANHFIRSRYHDLKSMFAQMGMEFYYLPYLRREHDVEAQVRYYAPYLSPNLLVSEVQSNALVPYISDEETRRNLKPSIIFDGQLEGYGGDVTFLQMPLSDIDFNQSESIEDLKVFLQESEAYYREFYEIQSSEQEAFCKHQRLEDFAPDHLSSSCPSYAPPAEEKSSLRSKPKASSSNKGLLRRFMSRFNKDDASCSDASGEAKTAEELAEEQSLIETEKVLRELRRTVESLRLRGVSLMAIHEFIDKQEPLSRMVITPDYRIFLPDYNDMEIVMGALPKAIYFLFLRYPEGIICKHMQDYYNELLNIYRQLRPQTEEARLNLTITKVVNPLGNALNENIARIRKAFVEKFDEHLANNYIITGERGSQYSIPLDRDLIIWEE